MKERVIKFFEFVAYWTIVLIPFSMSISPVPAEIFSGWLIFSFLIVRILKKESPFPKTGINLQIVFLFIISLVSMLHAVSLKDSIKGGILRLLQYVFVLFAMMICIKDDKHLRKIFISMLLGACLISIDGIWQIFKGHDFIRGYEPILNIGLVRATASFRDANLMGIYLSAIVPFILGLTLYYFKGKMKALMILISLFVILGVGLTYSRPALLAVYVSLLFLGIVKKDKLIIAILVIGTILSPFIAPKSVKEWAKQVHYNPLVFMCNDDRITIFRNSISMIKHHPVIGVGVNNFMKNYRIYKEVPEYKGITTSEYCYAHNNFLQMAGEIGLVGLGIFAWFLYGLFLSSAKIYRGISNQYIKIVSLSIIACLIAFLINGLTESSLYYARLAMIFWYLAGFSLSLKKFSHAAG